MSMSLTERSTIYDTGLATSPARKTYLADYLGTIPYKPALKLQQRLMRARSQGTIPDVVPLLQHLPVFTIGRFRGQEDIITPKKMLAQKGIDVCHTNRGGRVTYHGPGQLIGYPILNLKENRLGVREYIWKLEEVTLRLLSILGIEGHRRPRYPGGVWVGDNKICSIGIHVSHHITMHGLALNVNTDLRYFDDIFPCGMPGNVMTSIAKILGNHFEPEDIIDTFLDSFSETFGLRREKGLDKCLDTLDAPSG